MAGRTPAEAVTAYLEPLGQAISCITVGVLSVSQGGRIPQQNPHVLLLNNGLPQPLAGGLMLTIQQGYEIVQAEGERGPWKCSTTEYHYALDHGDAEIIAYHWHPAGASDVTRPHAHLGAGAKVAYPGLTKAHLPTNRISMEDFLLLIVRDLEVPTLRDDWEDVIGAARGKFESWQTWAGSGPSA